jgi:peptide/nickel transport system substrate-binding protein
VGGCHHGTRGEAGALGATRRLVKLVHRAAGELDKQKQIQLSQRYQQIMVDLANLFVLLQPIYQIGVRRTIKALPLTTAGGQVEMFGAQPR